MFLTFTGTGTVNCRPEAATVGHMDPLEQLLYSLSINAQYVYKQDFVQ